MINKLIVATAFLVISACGGGSSGGGEPAMTPPPVDTSTNNNGSPMPVTGGPVTAGTTGNMYQGSSAFGPSVYVVDANNNLFGFSSNGQGQYEAVFGNIADTNPELRFEHRDSDVTNLDHSYTVAGELIAGAETLDLNLAVANDGQSLNNTGTVGNFSLLLADNNDFPALAVADVAGTWVARNAFCAVCELELLMTFAADGSMVGYTKFTTTGNIAAAQEIPLQGTVSSAGQYLNISFSQNTRNLTGVVYIDPTTSKMVLNTSGLESVEDGDRSFSARMTGQ